MPQQTTSPQPAAPAKPKPQPPPMPPAELQEKDIATMDAAGLVRILKDPNASEFQKAKASQRAGELGVKDAIPLLAAMLADEHLSSYARYGLEPMQDPAADEALRAALTRLKGVRLIGVINSIGKRRDAKAAPALLKMLYGPDLEVARACASAIGSIGNAAAVKDLQAALAKTTGPLKLAVADACLVCADRLLADGKRDQAMALWTAMSAADLPKPVRLGAMSSIVREETSINRPR